MNIPENIQTGVNRIALIIGIAAFCISFFAGANWYYKAKSYYATFYVTPNGTLEKMPQIADMKAAGFSDDEIIQWMREQYKRGVKNEWVRPRTIDVIEHGGVTGTMIGILTFFGIHGIVRLSVWVYEGFKK